MAVIRVGKLPDKQVIRLISAFTDKWGTGDNSQIRLGGMGVSLLAAEYPEFSKSLTNLDALDSADIYSQPPKITLQFRRGTGGINNNIDGGPRQPSPYFDEVGIIPQNDHQGRNAAAPSDIVEAMALVKRVAGATPPADADPSNAVDLLNAQFSQLNGLLSEVTERVHIRQIEMDDQYRERQEKFDAEHQLRESRLEEEIASRSRKLDEQSSLLKEREEAIDNRQHMHARRDLREKITGEIERRLQTTLVHKQSFAIRYGVLAIMLVAGIGLGAMSFFSLGEYTLQVRLSTMTSVAGELSDDVRVARDMVTTGTIWYLLGRAALSGFGAVAFLLYAISWLKRIYSEDVRAQRDLERYSIDLSRASWAIETIMEAKSNGDVSIPDILVAGVSNNLFDMGQKGDSDGNDALASILKASIKGKIGPDGAEFDFNNRGTNKLAKEVEG